MKLVKRITCSSIEIISTLISSSVALLIESQTLITFTSMLHICPLIVRSLNFLYVLYRQCPIWKETIYISCKFILDEKTWYFNNLFCKDYSWKKFVWKCDNSLSSDLTTKGQTCSINQSAYYTVKTKNM